MNGWLIYVGVFAMTLIIMLVMSLLNAGSDYFWIVIMWFAFILKDLNDIKEKMSHL
jgi:hypothetical protein